MCRGTEEERSRGGFQRSEIHKEDVSTHDTVACALCGSPASLHCPADDAFLCRKCDRWVHGANFLAQRHIRCFLCSSCQGLTHRHLIATSTEMWVGWDEDECPFERMKIQIRLKNCFLKSGRNH
ncbi:hypothetical protein C3L33_10310, partial [Rhododendron williamsianum]